MKIELKIGAKAVEISLKGEDTMSTTKQISPPEDHIHAQISDSGDRDIFRVYLGIQMNFYLNPDEFIVYHVV
jgi:hypothetical protein